MLLFVVDTIAFACLALVLIDRRMHQRDPAFGVNQWGYRDEARGSKEPGEIRVAIVGGSSAFEGGLALSRTFAGQLFFELRDALAPGHRETSVVNLAEPQAAADSYVQTLRAYDYLDPDVVCVFDGYDSLEGLPPHARRRSMVFRATGYLPTLPARLLLQPSWMSDPDRGVAEVLLDGRGGPADVSCAGASASYCAAMAATVRAALERTRAVIVVSPPSVSARHAEQQRSLGAALAREFGREGRFAYLDLGSAIDLSSPIYAADRMHRTETANHVVGQRVASAILTLLGRSVTSGASR